MSQPHDGMGGYQPPQPDPAQGGYPAAGYPTGGAYQPGAYPADPNQTGAYPASPYPADPNQTGAYPAGPYPVSGYPASAYPAGAYPADPNQTGAYPTGAYPTGQVVPQSPIPPQYPPTPADSGSKGTRAFLIVGGVVVALVLVWVGVFTAYRTLAKDSPSDVTQKFMTALQENNRTRALDLACAQVRATDLNNANLDLSSNERIVEWKITRETKGKYSAEVATLLTYRGSGSIQTATLVFTLVPENGEWKICSVRLGQ